MKTIVSKLAGISIIVLLVFSAVKPTYVFADEGETVITEVVTTEPVVDEGEIIATEIVATESITAEPVVSEDTEATQIIVESETEDQLEATAVAETETTLPTEEISEIVELMADEGLTLVDENGSPLPMASEETSQLLENSDPFFWDGTQWVGYTTTGTGCPLNVTCLSSATPFQSAVTAASALSADTNIYVATGTYDEDVIINSTNKLSFTGFNSVTVDGANVVVNDIGFAKVNKITLNSNFGDTSGVYADSVIVGTNGELSDALNLVNPANVEATITAQMKLVSSGDYYKIQDSNTPSDSYEWECGEPDTTITFNEYTMILKSPNSADVLSYYTTNFDQRPDFSAMDSSTYISKNYSLSEANLLLTAQERIADVISAASASELASWSNMDEQRVFWNLLGHMSGKVDSNNHAGAYDGNLIQTENQFNLAKQFTFTDNQDLPDITQKLWFLWPSGTASPLNTQLTFMKLTIPSTGCTDPATCKSCPTGQKFTEGVGCEPIICETGTQLVENTCEPIVCGPDEQLVGNDCVQNPSQDEGLTIPVTGGLPIPVTGTRIIVGGLGHTCMTAGNGEVLCWGLNESGQVGDGTNLNQLKPVFVEELDDVIDLTAGSLHTCALKSNGEVWCWGENGSGQIGNNTTTDTNLPVQVMGLPDEAIDISGGEEFTCALLKDLEVWCWGENGLGQLNNGSTQNSSQPVKSILANTQNAISAGQEALLGDSAGNVDSWSEQQSTLVEEMGSSLYLFGDRWNMGGCAINFNGEVKCWNDDQVSKLVEGSKPAYMVETGIDHGCSLNADGSVSCWGVNLYGQLGNGTNQDSTEAVSVSGINAAKEIGIGRNHSCVLVGNGYTAMCWGENTYGQLGNDSTLDSNLPVYVIEP